MKKVITAFVTVCCLCFFIFGSAVYTYSLKMEKMNEKADSFNRSGDWHLTDHYDRKGHNYYEFLERKDSLTILKKVYQKLSELSKLEYYEVSDQDIGIFGKFGGSEKLVRGGKDGLNQKADGTYYSPLKSIQLSKNYAESQSLSSSITEGRAFSDDDYKKDKNRIIPVIAGAGYKDIFDLNETFEGIYLGDMKIKYRIVGFLKSRSEIEIDQEHKKLDSYIICPNIQVTKNDSADFQKTLLSVKSEGYLHYNNKKEAQLLTHTIRKIVKETGYQYDIPRTHQMSENILGLSAGPAFFLFAVSFILLIYCFYKIYRLWKQEFSAAISRFGLRTSLCLMILQGGTWIFGAFVLGKYMTENIFSDYRTIIRAPEKSILLFLLFVYLLLMGLLYLDEYREKKSG